MIELKNVSYEYPKKRALDNVSFKIEKGTITALVGPNGAGKTTLMHCISALEKPFSGSIEVDGIDTTKDPREVHKKIGYLSDFFGLYKYLTVKQCLEFSARIHQIAPGKIEERISEIAENLNLTSYLNYDTGQLSRGFRQILGIAQALIHDPKILILDEPTSGLDPEARALLTNLFKKLQKRGMTLLVSSHIISELEDYCSEMLLLREGKIVEHCKGAAIEAQQSINLKISVLGNAQNYLDKFCTLQKITEIKINGEEIECDFSGDEEDLSNLLKEIISQNIPIFNFSSQKHSLREIYIKHTKIN